jgi:hypothetical protein
MGSLLKTEKVIKEVKKTEGTEKYNGNVEDTKKEGMKE